MSNVIFEGLEQNDLVRLVKPEIHIDEYKSKLGKDEDVIVVSFKVKSKEAAEDLESFIEKGYEWVLDADISEGEMMDGDHLVFVECDRNPEFPKNLISMMNDIILLTGHSLSDYMIQVRSNPELFKLSLDNLKDIPTTPDEYLRRYGVKELDEMRTAAGLQVHTTAPKNDFTRLIKTLAGTN